MSNLERAVTRNFLWPPIHDAADTYLRRKARGAEAYELVWRLIHIWEAGEITLALASMACWAHVASNSDTRRKLNAYFYGMTWDEALGEFRRSPGACDGSIDQWINILEEASRPPVDEVPFLAAVHQFIESQALDLAALFRSWGQACDAPASPTAVSNIRVREAMRYVNALRNRFAHVPFPHDALADVAAALEDVTERLFQIAPAPSSHAQGGVSSPLTGAIVVAGQLLRGGQSISEAEATTLELRFPAVRQNAPHASWRGTPFVFVDSMMRPHILTRLKEATGCEYTRYRAEARAIAFIEIDLVGEMIPRPQESEFARNEGPVITGASPDSAMLMQEAISAFRREDYAAAISPLKLIIQQRPDYHIAWLRLGHALREQAVRMRPQDAAGATDLLQEGLEALTQATGHRDREFQAQAFYERSKVYYQLMRTNAQLPEAMASALGDATMASQLSADIKYKSWFEYLSAGSTRRDTV